MFGWCIIISLFVTVGLVDFRGRDVTELLSLSILGKVSTHSGCVCDGDVL